MIATINQPLGPDSRLGHYVIRGMLGAGGMGEVYEAEDTRLHRRIALKVVHRDVASDSSRRPRLEREAAAAAKLNHPNIVTLHSIEEHDAVLFLTMELIEGTTLAETIAQGALPVGRVLALAVQLADALAAAHACGIVHRDLKPANVMITRDGVLKVLDFGLSRVAVDEAAATRSTEALTADGALVGTVPYMSPEQIQGNAADWRSDIFSLGIVLFEMSTGRTPFSGKTPLATLTAIVKDVPPLASEVNAGVPVELARLIDRCLAKEPLRRTQSALDARHQLEDVGRLLESPPFGGRLRWPSVYRTRRGRRTARGLLAAGMLLGVAGLIWLLLPRPSTVRREVVRFAVDLPQNQVFLASLNPDVTWSRDGARIAFTPFTGPVSIRPVDSLNTQPLEATSAPGFRGAPLFSPDGAYLSFIEGNAIFSSSRPFQKAALSGGAAVELTEYDMFHRGDWSADGWIYWTAQYPGGIVRIRDSGGEIEKVTDLDLARGERSHRFAGLTADGQAIIYTVGFDGIDSYDDARIDLWDLKTRRRRTLFAGGMAAVYSPPGHIVYARAGKLFAVAFDARKQEVAGSPFEVVDGVLMSGNTGAAQFAVSSRGDLAYVPGAAEGGRRRLVWVDRTGSETPLTLPEASYLYPRISPDGRSFAVEIEGPNHDFYVYDIARSVLSKMTTDGLSHAPVWTPDGKRLAFRSWQAGGMTLWWMPADRSANAERLDPSGTRQSPVSFSPDGQFLAIDQKGAATRDDVWVLPITSGRRPEPLAGSRFGEGSGKFSPDGRWIAYSSDESGRPQVYVQRFPGPGAKVQISKDGGIDPVWRRSGGELYYRGQGKMWVVSVATSGEFKASAPEELFADKYSAGAASSCGMPGVSSSNYDVTADGQRFLMVRDDDSALVGKKVVVVLNWAEELAAREERRSLR